MVIAVAAVGLFAAAPSGAVAGTVSTDMDSPPTFVGDAGETNSVTVASDAGSVTFTDANHVITEASDDCTGDATNTVTCALMGDSWTGWYVSAGDMNDVVVATGTRGGHVNGGEGNDSLTGSNLNTSSESFNGGSGNDAINTGARALDLFGSGDSADGDDGNDTITGSNGGDELYGSDGTDVIDAGAGDDYASGGPGDADRVSLGEGDDYTSASNSGNGDVYDGGPGIDEFEFFNSSDSEASPDAFSVNLDAGFGNRINNVPSSSTVANFEDVSTSDGPDTVVGSTGSNVIETYRGNDVVNPGAGGDIAGTSYGDDSVNSVDGFADRINCGPGTDTLQADQLDTQVNCEVVTVATTRPAGADLVPPVCTLAGVKKKYRYKAFKRGLTAVVACGEATSLKAQILATVKNKKGKVVIARAGDVVIGEASTPIGVGTRSLKVKPGKLGSQFRTGSKVRLVIQAVDEFGNRMELVKRVKVTSNKKKAAKCNTRSQKRSQACKGKAKRDAGKKQRG